MSRIRLCAIAALLLTISAVPAVNAADESYASESADADRSKSESSKALPKKESSDKTTIQVEVEVRGPDGKLVGERPVKILDFGDIHLRRQEPEITPVTTDKHGIARFEWKWAARRIYVRVPGVGQGATGLFAPSFDKPARPHLPRLVPFASLSGTVPANWRDSKTRVQFYLNFEKRIDVDCDREGRFSCVNVPSGFYYLRLINEKGPDEDATAQITLMPGVHSTIDQFEIRKTRVAGGRISMRMPGARSDAVWAKGVVADEESRPLPGARVYAVASFHAGIRGATTTTSVVTDAKGRYEIKGESNLTMFQGRLVAHSPGRPYQVVDFPCAVTFEKEDDEPPPRPDFRHDFILPEKGGELSVLVTHEGKPVEKVAVSLLEEHVKFLNGLARSSSPDQEDDLDKQLWPTVATNERGIAKFDNLPRGVYTVFADGMDATESPLRRGRLSSSVDGCRADGISVRPGQPREHHFELSRKRSNGSIDLLRLDGVAVPLPYDHEAEPVDETSDFVRMQGNSVSLSEVGLWRLSARSPENQSRELPWFEPYQGAKAVAAASPLLPAKNPMPLTARTMSLEPVALTVNLLDQRDRPNGGYVFLSGDRYGLASRAAACGDGGLATFQGTPDSEIHITAYAAKSTIPPLAWTSRDWPADDKLVGHTAYLSKRLSRSIDSDRNITLRSHPVGFIRGKVRLDSGKAMPSYLLRVVGQDNRSAAGLQQRIDRSTNELLIGPLAEGNVTLLLYPKPDLPAHKANQAVLRRTVNVSADRVGRVVFDLDADPSKPDPDVEHWISAGDFLDSDAVVQVQGKVFQADGVRPALGVRVKLFLTGQDAEPATGITDSFGHFRMTPVSAGWPNRLNKDRPEPIDVPMLAAELPGETGSALVRLPKFKDRGNIKIVLPKPLALRGAVTIGGKKLASHPSQITVKAVYEGNDLRSSLADRTCTADADGNFELAGLLAGTYQIQATVDKVWLSTSKTLTVATDTDKLDEFSLDIAAPGPATRLTLVDDKGVPQVGVALSVDRPTGPLTESLWPKRLTTDGAGVVYLPPLEAGKHTLVFPGLNARETIEIAPLGKDSEPRPLKLVLKPVAR